MEWPRQEEALELLKEFTTNEHLIKHAFAVEAAMRAYAKKFNQDADKWAVTGLLHDFDYEKYPSAQDHPFKGAKILEEKGYPQAMIRAILAHGDHTGIAREDLMEKTLYAVDELAGFIVAVSLVRPSKKISEVATKSILKKWKDKAFARNVNRENIEKGAKDIGLNLEEHIECTLQAMQNISDKLGL